MHRKARRYQKNHEILFGVHPVREAILQKKRNFLKLYLYKTKGSILVPAPPIKSGSDNAFSGSGLVVRTGSDFSSFSTSLPVSYTHLTLPTSDLV